MSAPSLVIRPPQRRTRLELRSVWEHRELLYFFVWRNIKVRYKQSIVGAGWAFIQPLLLMLVFTLFFGRLAGIPSDDIPRPLFYYAAILPWTYFSNSVNQATLSVVANGGLVTKVYFPRLTLPLSSVLSVLVDFAIAFVLLMGLIGYYVVQGQVDLTPAAALVPLFIILAVATALGAGLWLAALNAKYRDVQHIVAFLLQFWMFASPVAYPSSMVPERWRALYGLNPMAGVIDGFRWSLTGRGQPPGPLLAASTAAVLLLLLGGLWYFRKLEGTMADVV